MALSPGKIEGANNLPVRMATWNTRIIIDNHTINMKLNEWKFLYLDNRYTYDVGER